jgi:hypothetical protein
MSTRLSDIRHFLFLVVDRSGNQERRKRFDFLSTLNHQLSTFSAGA